MYLHLGKDTVITTKSIIGIFDMDRCTVSKKTRLGRTTVNITGDAACAIIVSKLEDKKEARSRAVLK